MSTRPADVDRRPAARPEPGKLADDLRLIASSFSRDHMPRTAANVRWAADAVDHYRSALLKIARRKLPAKELLAFVEEVLEGPRP